MVGRIPLWGGDRPGAGLVETDTTGKFAAIVVVGIIGKPCQKLGGKCLNFVVNLKARVYTEQSALPGSYAQIIRRRSGRESPGRLIGGPKCGGPEVTGRYPVARVSSFFRRFGLAR